MRLLAAASDLCSVRGADNVVSIRLAASRITFFPPYTPPSHQANHHAPQADMRTLPLQRPDRSWSIVSLGQSLHGDLKEHARMLHTLTPAHGAARTWKKHTEQDIQSNRS